MVLPENPNDDLSKSKYIIDPLKYDYPAGKNPNIHQARYLAPTITAEPHSANSIEDILNRPHFKHSRLMIRINMSLPKLRTRNTRLPQTFLLLMACG